MRDVIFLVIGMMIGGALAMLVLCALQLGARHERIQLNSENSEDRR